MAAQPSRKYARDGSMTDQEALRKQISRDFPGLDTVRRLYEDEVDLPAADAISPPVDHLTDDRLRDMLNLGQHFLSLSGHGSQGGCCLLGNTMAQNATNGFHTFIAWADSCLTNDFQWEDSMSENLLKNSNGGAVGYVGNTRFSWIGLGDDFQREFFRQLKYTRHLALLNDSRFNLPNSSEYWKWIKFSLNLLGDPEMPLWVGKPDTMRVTHPSETHANENLTVMSSSNTPISNAIVCFASGDNWVITGSTDSAGHVVLNLNPPVLGNLEVVVTAPDCLPYFGSVTVKQAYPDVKVTVHGLNNTHWGGKIHFNATVTGSNNQEVEWSLAVETGNGTINQQGVYTAPQHNCGNAAIATSVANQTDQAKWTLP